nr:uncharacterized protein LOC112695940 [Arachis hypogaea]
MFCLPESFTLPYPTLATLFDPLPPLRRATTASVRRARPPFVRVATAPKSPTPLLSSSASSPHPLLFATSCHRLHLLAVVWSVSSINEGSVGVIFEDLCYSQSWQLDYNLRIIVKLECFLNLLMHIVWLP